MYKQKNTFKCIKYCIRFLYDLYIFIRFFKCIKNFKYIFLSINVFKNINKIMKKETLMKQNIRNIFFRYKTYKNWFYMYKSILIRIYNNNSLYIFRVNTIYTISNKQINKDSCWFSGLGIPLANFILLQVKERDTYIHYI